MPGESDRADAHSIEDLAERVENWRKTRVGQTRMPEELWQAAVVFARQRGAYATARDLRISYAGLRARLGPVLKRRSSQVPGAFVELCPRLATGASVSVVELVGASVAKLTIRLG